MDKRRGRRRGAISGRGVSDVDSVRHALPSKFVERVDSLYDVYANPSLGMIDPDGIQRLCSDMGVNHTDVRILMLAWKMKAKKHGYFSKEEWRTGLQALFVDSRAKLKKALPALKKEAMNPGNIRDFCAYAFQYSLIEERQKFIDIGTICELLNLVLGSQFRAQVNSITEYLKLQSNYQTLNKDQWMGFFHFCHEVNFPDLANYDAHEAWPVIIDDFVEWLRGKVKLT